MTDSITFGNPWFTGPKEWTVKVGQVVMIDLPGLDDDLIRVTSVPEDADGTFHGTLIQTDLPESRRNRHFYTSQIIDNDPSF